MKNFLYIIVFFTPFLSFGQQTTCPLYQSYIAKGEAELKKGDKADFKKAIEAFSNAMIHCPAKADEARSKIVKAFDAINALKKQAVKNAEIAKKAQDSTKIALQQAKEAQDSTKIALQQAKKAQDSTKIALQQAKKAQDSTKIALQQAKEAQEKTETALQEANTAKQKAQAVLDKIYFYKDRFGLAYDKNMGRYGFIDKDLNTKIAFDYEEALPFDYTGLAKVKKDGVYYLIDTTGKEAYKLATDINQLSAGITALDLRDKNLSEVPPSLLKHTELKVLLLKGNKIPQIPEGLKTLTNLRYLDLSQNQIAQLENLDSLANLVYFNISGSYDKRGEIQKLEGLDNLKALQAFDISSNQIQKLEGLDNLKALQSFDISSNQIQKLEGLDNLKALQAFSIYSNQIQKLEGLDNLKALQAFYISSNQIQKLEGLEQLKNIKTLSIGGNPLSIVEINQRLKAMPNIEELWLSDLGLTTLLDVVFSLKHLKKLYLWNYRDETKNNFSEAEQAKIKKLLPNCQIEF